MRKEKSDGVFYAAETLTTSPEDGFVEHHKPQYNSPIKEKHFGFSKSYVFVTNDPKITRPFVYSVCRLFFVIGLLALLFGNWFVGIVSISSSVIVFRHAKKDIDRIEEKINAEKKEAQVKEN